MIYELLLAPALVLVASLPLGVALVRLAWRGEPPPERVALLATPCGFSLVILVLEASRVVLGGTPGWVLPLTAAGGIVLAILTGARRPGRVVGWTLAGIAALYAVLTFPEWLQAGRTVVLGYQRNNDPVFLTVLAQLIGQGKEALPPPYVTDAYLHYPAGSLDLIGAVAATLGRSAFEVTVPTHAIAVAMLGPCMASLLYRLSPRPARWTLPLAGLGVLASLPIIWYAQGASPSMIMLVPLLGALLASWDAVREARWQVGALAGLCAGAAVTVYGLSTLGWIASFVALLAATTVAERGRASLRPLAFAAMAAVGVGVLALPGAVRAWHFNVESHDAVTGGLVLGNLGAALDPLLTVGVDRTLATVLTLPAFAIAGALILAGVARALGKPASLAVLLLFACAFTTIYATLAGPYYVAKALTVATLVLVALAIYGAQELAQALSGKTLALGALGAAVAIWAAGSLYTAEYYLRTSAKTPAWLEQLAGVRRRAEARGPTLISTPVGQTWTAWALRSPALRVSQLLPGGAKPVFTDYATVVVEPGGTPPGAPFRLTRRIGDLRIYER